MEIISAASEVVLQILGRPKDTVGSARMMRFCAETRVEEGVLLHNLLTRELLLLSEEEYQQRLENEYLVRHYFVVREDTKDKELVQLVKWVLSTKKKNDDLITSYTIFPTTDCNARCFYCFELGRSRIPMSKETAQKVVRYIKNHCGEKKVNLSWFGGEPLFNQEAIDTICDGLSREKIEYSSYMVSNGYLFEEETVEKASKLWNLKRVQITLDGTEKVYNRVKAYIYKEGSAYQRVLDNIERLLNRSIAVVIRLNMDLYNAEDLLLLADELAARFAGRNNFGVYAHHIFEGNESMKGMHSDEGWEQREKAMNALFEKLVKTRIASKSGISKTVRLTRCMADSDGAITILPNGDIGLCEHFSDSEFIGHIDSPDFDKKMIESWKETMPEVAECETCFYYPECVMLKKCSNENLCFPQYRDDLLRKTHWRMVCQYNKWLNCRESDDEENDESC